MKTTPICLALAMLFSAGTSHAATDAKLLARIERMAAELEAVKAELKTVNLNSPLRSPAGVCVAQQAVWIANTDAHGILKLDLKTGRLARLPVTS